MLGECVCVGLFGFWYILKEIIYECGYMYVPKETVEKERMAELSFRHLIRIKDEGFSDVSEYDSDEDLVDDEEEEVYAKQGSKKESKSFDLKEDGKSKHSKHADGSFIEIGLVLIVVAVAVAVILSLSSALVLVVVVEVLSSSDDMLMALTRSFSD
jgi:hypothetical protein